MAATGLVIFVIKGWLLLSVLNPPPSFSWMCIAHVDDFSSWGDVNSFLFILRTGVPLGTAFLELCSFMIWGSTDWVDVYLFRMAVLGSFLVAMYVSYKHHPLRGVLSFGLSFMFLFAWRHIHIGSPSVYDAFFVAYLFGIIFLVEIMGKIKRSSLSALCSVGAAGCLMGFHFTRPYGIILLPVLILWGVFKLKSYQKKVWHFILPLSLIVIWHLYLLVQCKQVIWSNHSGFNLQKAWPTVISERELLRENIDPYPMGPSINTEQHSQKSKYLRSKIMQKWIDDPAFFFYRVFFNLHRYPTVPVDLFNNHPVQAIINPYRVIVLMLFGYVFVKFGLLFLQTTVNIWRRHYDAIKRTWEDVGSIILFVLVASILITVVSDRGEESRFILQLLPLIAACPGMMITKNET